MKYYLLPNNEIVAHSSRGIFILADLEWYPALGTITEHDLQQGNEVDLNYVNTIVNERRRRKQMAGKSVYVDRISMGSGEINGRIRGAEYLSFIPVIKALLAGKMLEICSPVTFFVGDNGTGKSTLLEAMAIALGYNPEGGSKNFDFATKDTHSELHKIFHVSRIRPPKDGFFLRAESFYNLASNIDDLGVTNFYGGHSLHDQSHGESFMSLIRHRFFGKGLYILDEPEAALSPARILQLMREIKRLVDLDSQFFIATHSPILMTFPQAQIFECTRTGIKEKRYEELDSFILTRDFLNDPEHMLATLFDE